VVTMKNAISWDFASCGSCKNQTRVPIKETMYPSSSHLWGAQAKYSPKLMMWYTGSRATLGQSLWQLPGSACTFRGSCSSWVALRREQQEQLKSNHHRRDWIMEECHEHFSKHGRLILL
jgi:hypothetical protein